MVNRSVTIQLDGICFRVEGKFTPGRKGKDYLPNGDPGYQSESADFEIYLIQILHLDTGEPPSDITRLASEVYRKHRVISTLSPKPIETFRTLEEDLQDLALEMFAEIDSNKEESL